MTHPTVSPDTTATVVVPGGPRLPRRLQGLLAALPCHGAVADIGSGHGRLAAHLVRLGAGPVIATDISAAAVAEITDNLQRWGLADRIDVRCGDGLVPLQTAEVKGIVLAGVGARTIIAIASMAREKEVEWMALQPMQRAGLIEPWLAAAGWTILHHSTIAERDRTYPTWIAEVRR